MKAPIATFNKALLLSVSLSLLSGVHLRSGQKRCEKYIQPTKEDFTKELISFPLSKFIENLDTISPANDLHITMIDKYLYIENNW